MNIRTAQARDLAACLNLDASYETEYVWQMESARQNPAELGAVQLGKPTPLGNAPASVPRGGVVYLTFRVTRLPRAMRVLANITRDQVMEDFERGECFLVAAEGEDVIGFVDATANPWLGMLDIAYLTVAPERRRRGIGSQLLRATVQWAREHELQQVRLAASTKNFPATSLAQKHGFVFAGFDDHYYRNRDIALFFALVLR
jgi:ribosomal protein S18 acetylase RimI-like enzyme